ncbi:MAG: DNA-binding protein [Spirochaetae bacterium HGW-Spirochaetae-1]|jgi:HEPN domain-containing protein|nr:MAG: DNA-binding protein [Spirochaetae bacterium HGW-Spirochaetae-1]
MKGETASWLAYAQDNVDAAEILITSELYNPALQNIQQVIEKYLKALLLDTGTRLKRTHSINELVSLLKDNSIMVKIDDDEIDLIDSIYLPSKYPGGSALPDFIPDKIICNKCFDILMKVKQSVSDYLNAA